MAKRKRKQVRNLPKRPSFSVWFDAKYYENVDLSKLNEIGFDGRRFEVLDYQLVDEYVVFDLGNLLHKEPVHHSTPDAFYDWMCEFEDSWW